METFDSEVIGQILLLHRGIVASQDSAATGEQVCRVLMAVPGLISSALLVDGNVVAIAPPNGSPLNDFLEQMELQRATISEIGLWPQIEVFPLRTSHDSYSALIVAVSDRKAFLPYGPFLRTTADLIVLVLENKAQAAELRSLNTNREEQVSQRINEHLASEARYRAIFETTVDAIITIDERGTILLTNPATEQLFGYRADEMTGENVSLLMPSPDRERHDEYLEHFRRTGIGKIIGTGREVLGRRKDGSTFPIRLAVSEMRGGESACS